MRTLFHAALIITVSAMPAMAAMPEVKISEATARVTALKLVKDGIVKSSELEKEHGTMVYSFDITQPNKSGVEEVLISAYTGKLIERHHEGKAAMAAEAAADAVTGNGTKTK